MDDVKAKLLSLVQEGIDVCDVNEAFDDRVRCKADLLRTVTEAQDRVNLDVMADFRRTDPGCSKDPRWVPVHVVDNANAVILGIVGAAYETHVFWREGSYVREKFLTLCSQRLDLP